MDGWSTMDVVPEVLRPQRFEYLRSSIQTHTAGTPCLVRGWKGPASRSPARFFQWPTHSPWAVKGRNEDEDGGAVITEAQSHKLRIRHNKPTHYLNGLCCFVITAPGNELSTINCLLTNHLLRTAGCTVACCLIFCICHAFAGSIRSTELFAYPNQQHINQVTLFSCLIPNALNGLPTLQRVVTNSTTDFMPGYTFCRATSSDSWTPVWHYLE